ncbi:MAG: M24 family metallopeptidase [Kosmotogaceae bacterium]
MKDKRVLPLKENVSKNKILKQRLEELLPEMMKKKDSHMWIIIGNENHLDPIMPTMLPDGIDLGRLAIIVFCFHNGKFERHLISRAFTESDDLFKASFDQLHIDEWDSLKRIVDRCKPKNIMINFSDAIKLCDGLTYTNYKRLNERLAEYSQKFESSEELALMWLNKRTKKELDIFKSIVKKTEEIIENVFNTCEISELTTEKLERNLSQKAYELGMTVWYNKVDFQRKGKASLFNKGVIRPGDLIHCDFGVRYLGLSSDIQKLFYLLEEDEDDIPGSFKNLLKQTNQLQIILSNNLSKGLTGNEVLKNTISEMNKKGKNGRIYSHPLGYYGHGSVPVIGKYNQQNEVPVEGDYMVYDSSFWAIELCMIGNIPEWNNQRVHIFVEDSAALINNRVHFISERQHFFNILKR